MWNYTEIRTPSSFFYHQFFVRVYIQNHTSPKALISEGAWCNRADTKLSCPKNMGNRSRHTFWEPKNGQDRISTNQG